MRQTNTRLMVEQNPLSVIDVLTAGFEIVRKRPWTMVIPFILDAAIWILPKLSLSALVRPVMDAMFSTSGLTPDAAANVEQTQQALRQTVEGLNLLGIVAAALNSVARVPTLLAVDSTDVHSPINAFAYSIPLNSGVAVALLFVPLFLLGLFGAALYVEWIAQGVRPLESAPRLAWAPRVAALWLKLVAFSAILGAFLIGGGLILLLAQSFGGIGGEPGSIFALLLTVGSIWLFLYLFFVVSALAVSGVGVLEAIRRSIILFRLHFWATLGLVVLVFLLDRGLALIWHGLTVSAPGVVFAIALNAFIGTALLAATMVFYQDRLNWSEKLRTKKR